MKNNPQLLAANAEVGGFFRFYEYTWLNEGPDTYTPLQLSSGFSPNNYSPTKFN